MKRLPDDLIMEALFQHGELTDAHLKKLADALARFHLNASSTPEIDRFGEADQFKVNTDENFEETNNYIDITIDQADYDALSTWTSRFYMTNDALFRERIAAGKIRDCHGDLHMEHICFTDELAVFDCIEFNDRFRYSDTLSDIAFLLMDLEFHDGNAFAEKMWDYYKESAREGDVESLLTFYKVYRAYVRGKVTSFQLDDAQIAPEEKSRAADAARKYFKLARSYVEGVN
jgi:aminoglycoside phosphotransferase family enzyme